VLRQSPALAIPEDLPALEDPKSFGKVIFDKHTPLAAVVDDLKNINDPADLCKGSLSTRQDQHAGGVC
jgi:hypothetical protein